MTITLLNNNNNVQPLAGINLQIIDENSTIIFDENVTASNAGNFSFTPNINQSLQGQDIIFRYTNTETNQFAEFPYTLPLLDSVPLDIDIDGVIYTGDDGSYGSYTVFPGVASTINITKPDSTTQTINQAGSNSESNFLGLSFPFGSQIGYYSITITANGYTTNSFTTNFEVNHGLKVELIPPNGLRFRNDTHTINITGEPNAIVTMAVFNDLYPIVLDGAGNANYIITIPNDADYGDNIANFTTPNYPNTESVTLKVDNPADYALSCTFPSQIITNPQQNSNSEISGLALPGKLVAINIPELNLNLYQITKCLLHIKHLQ